MPIEPARLYRRLLVESGEFVSMRQKIARTPDAEKLLGALGTSAARAIGSQVGREIILGVLGSIFGSTTTRRRR